MLLGRCEFAREDYSLYIIDMPRDDILKSSRAGYGEEIVSTLSRQLVELYGNGFSLKNVRHMMKFAEVFPDEKIVSTLWRQLYWSPFK